MFQREVNRWAVECFGEEIARDKSQRSHRFLEEALELVQAGACTKEEAHQLVDYVFDRPVGEITQEVGGVMVTLAAFCNAYGINMRACGNNEVKRIWTKVEKIRAKNLAKPKFGPLPGKYECEIPPEGWRCTREPGHEPPCAAVTTYTKEVL